MTDKAKKVVEWAKGSPTYARVDPALASVIGTGLALCLALGVPEMLGTDAETFSTVAFAAGAFITAVRSAFLPKASA